MDEQVSITNMDLDSDCEDDQETNYKRRWRLSHLKDQFETLELHKLFNRYTERISHGYFSQFLSLQIILVTAHFIILLASVIPTNKIIADLTLYGTISILSCVTLILTDIYVKDYPKLLKMFCIAAFITVFFMNEFIPIYYRNKAENPNLRPAYTTYAIIASYIFLDVRNNWIALGLGSMVSISHIITLFLVTYDSKDQLYRRLVSDAVYLISINGLGLYFRYMNEIVIRRSFLDRRSCVETTYQLKFEQDQENQLMLSIIPKHILEEVRSAQNETKQIILEQLHIKFHKNVTILFADIVNYTAMTTQLPIIELLETLNELFGRFDDASEELQVLRIKFLGDCYYCVAGLPPDPAPNHAEACVDLGLKMISIIADVRNRRNLNINMRIGVHTGNINSGIIGKIKWQYDVWSTDVDLANKMETEGEAGMVHITTQTKNLLHKSYNMITTNKIINDQPTFLIAPSDHKHSPTPVIPPSGLPPEDEEVQMPRRSAIYKKRNSDLKGRLSNSAPRKSTVMGPSFIELQANGPTERRQSSLPNILERSINLTPRRTKTERRITHGDGKRRTAFMNNNIKRYKERLEETNQELEDTIENMRLSKFEQWFEVDDMNRASLTFPNWKDEMDFITIPDPLFKYYLLSELLLLVLVYIIENLTLDRWNWPTWPFVLTISVVSLIFVPLSWTHYIWSKFFSENELIAPKNKYLLFLYTSSKFVTKSVLVRTLIYTIAYFLFCLCVLYEWLDCSKIELDLHNEISLKNHYFLESLLSRNAQQQDCIVPWHMTETCALAIIMSFLFLRMYMFIKLLYAAAIAIIYSICVVNYSGQFYGESQTFNYMLSPQIAHIISVLFLTITLHLVDRQTEYMNRLDHIWYKTLVEKRQRARHLHIENKRLLKNILPYHVAEEYLNINRRLSDDVYNEHYDDAAVMFASITNYSVEEIGDGFLTMMNTIISEFDKLSIGTCFGRSIEKIKIAKWTYMAACGLVPGLGNVDNIRKDPANHVVICLLKFAVSLMKQLHHLNREHSQNMKLRIGVSYGAIAAGVVGSKKPLYDIWGDPVNMASRMDTTGVANRIQVLEPIAEIIQGYGYVCEYRGLVKVKGRDNLVATYFVAQDENFDLISGK